ncbi:MAG: DinB family protein [Actinopolymorphaceae bacterium]
MDQCTECGFSDDLDQATEAGPSIRAGAADFATVLRRTDVDVATRPAPAVWSPLEYGCHLRDVLLVQRERVLQARRTHQPAPAPMGRDERADHDGYTDQDPADVARQLTDAALMFAHVLSRLDPVEWERTLVYNYPEPTVRSLRWVAVHTLHEVRHHLLDVDRQRP